VPRQHEGLHLTAPLGFGGICRRNRSKSVRRAPRTRNVSHRHGGGYLRRRLRPPGPPLMIELPAQPAAEPPEATPSMDPATTDDHGVRPFTPARWASSPHAQTLGARVLRSGTVPPLSRRRWDTPDDDFLDLDVGSVPGEERGVVLVIHGLEGSSRRRYVLSACRELLDRGIIPVALNLRGCSGEPNRRPRMYHSGETGDLAFVLGRLREAYPGRALGAWGFSLGGNALLKLLGELSDGGGALLDAAVAVSVPFDLAAGSAFLERSFMGGLYTRYFLRSLKRKVRVKAALLADVIDTDRALKARTLREFDDVATAPLHGFRSAEHYYGMASSGRYLEGVRVPTLVVHSVDDPFLPSEAIPRSALRANPSLRTQLTRRGGHVGFLEGTPLRPRFWAEAEGARFLAERLGGGAQGASRQGMV
jgi:predicted alpha/beta-fold hydrolase